MIRNIFSVTNSVTEEMSTKGYDLYWPVAANGYEVHDGTELFFDVATYNDPRTKEVVYPHMFRYDRSTLLYYPGINPTLPEPEGASLRVLNIDTQPPWLVDPGWFQLPESATPADFGEKFPYRDYQPLKHRALHRTFAQIDTENLGKEALKFAVKYGLLGRRVSLQTLTPHPALSEATLPTGRYVEGESLVRWRAEIEKMGASLALWDMVCEERDEKTGKLTGFAHWLPNGTLELGFKWHIVRGRYRFSAWDREQKLQGFGHHAEIIGQMGYLRKPSFAPMAAGIILSLVLSRVSLLVENLINYHLEGIRPRFIVMGIGAPRDSEIIHVPHTLLDALWLLVMLEVQGKTKLARCKYCGNWFAYERSTREFCGNNHRRLYFYHKNHKEAQNERANLQTKG